VEALRHLEVGAVGVGAVLLQPLDAVDDERAHVVAQLAPGDESPGAAAEGQPVWPHPALGALGGVIEDGGVAVDDAHALSAGRRSAAARPCRARACARRPRAARRSRRGTLRGSRRKGPARASRAAARPGSAAARCGPRGAYEAASAASSSAHWMAATLSLGI